MGEYVEQLVGSLSLSSLSFAMNKLNTTFNSLLNWNNSNHNTTNNKWPGTVLFQRKLLRSLIQIVNQKNIDSQQGYYVKLQQLTNKFTKALDATNNDII